MRRRGTTYGRHKLPRPDAPDPVAGRTSSIDGLNIAKRHTKPRPASSQNTIAGVPQMQQGGILDIAQPLPLEQGHAGLPALRQARRASGTQTLAIGQRVRVCRHCGEPLEVADVNRLHERYQDEVVASLSKQFSYDNPMQVPRLEKIVVNVGLGEALTNAKAIDAAVGDLAADHRPEADRHPRPTLDRPVPPADRATRSAPRSRCAASACGTSSSASPRSRCPASATSAACPAKSFDGRGNFSLGLREQLAFPEIDYDKVDRLRGLEISIVTTAKTDEESKRLLELLGMPFAGVGAGRRPMAKKSLIAKAKRTPKFKVRGYHRCYRLRPAPRRTCGASPCAASASASARSWASCRA